MFEIIIWVLPSFGVLILIVLRHLKIRLDNQEAYIWELNKPKSREEKLSDYEEVLSLKEMKVDIYKKIKKINRLLDFDTFDEKKRFYSTDGNHAFDIKGTGEVVVYKREMQHFVPPVYHFGAPFSHTGDTFNLSVDEVFKEGLGFLLTEIIEAVEYNRENL